jgi:thiamine biosynthesis lipoprotein
VSALQWRDWSCSVRVVLADGRSAHDVPEPATALRIEHLVRGLMDDVARAASRFRPDSDLCRINAAAGRLVPVRRLTLELVEVALDAARRTAGACDPTIGLPLVAAGYDVDIDLVRSRGGTVDSRPCAPADWSAVRVDRELGRLAVPSGLALDLGATAKAWTADEAAARLARAVGVPVLVALGGDVAVSRGGAPWPVLVSEREGESGQVVSLVSGGVATSSTRGRRWATADGERHHLIDPRRGTSTDGALRTASVLGGSCVEANTFSTAALVWGSQAPGRLGDRPARLVDAAGDVVLTGGWPPEQVAA